jgi:hypothetical protein
MPLRGDATPSAGERGVLGRQTPMAVGPIQSHMETIHWKMR